MAHLASTLGIDWTDCTAVESIPGKVSGVPILKGTRMQADSVVENYEDGLSVEEIAAMFHLSEAMVQDVVTFAAGRYQLLQP